MKYIQSAGGYYYKQYKNENSVFEGLYGLRLKAIELRPYWIVLLLLTPVIYFVSFLPDFIDYYPSYKRAGGAQFAAFYNLSETFSKIIFEVFFNLARKQYFQ